MKYILALLLSFGSLSASAQIARDAAPTGIHVFPETGVFVFYATVTEGVRPNCQGDDRWALRTSEPAAAELISMVISATVSGRTVTVVGSDTCDSSQAGYHIQYLYLN